MSMMMGLRLSIKEISLLLILAHLAEGVPIDVTKYGAKANADIKQALLSAWKVACASRTPGIVTIPAGAYLLSPVYLQGPCNAPIGVQLQGSLKPSANGQTNTDGWIVFQKIQHLTLSGGGTLNAMGASAWNKNMGTKKNCKRLPPSIRFKYVNNSVVSGITTKDSKMFHMLVWGSRNLTFQDVTIVAPGESKNTDGIHISRSTGINVLNSKIGTGDDCVSIGDGCNNINIQNVICGPGHGISIGSLGKYPYEQPVVGVRVKNCSLSGTTNGVRIKTWPGSKPLTVSDIHFEDITMNNVKNPVIIDQEYCGYKSCPAKPPSKVKISKVSFKNIHGSSTSEVAVHLVCSKGVPCQDVELGNIDLTYRGGAAKSQQANVKPTITGKVNVH